MAGRCPSSGFGGIFRLPGAKANYKGLKPIHWLPWLYHRWYHLWLRRDADTGILEMLQAIKNIFKTYFLTGLLVLGPLVISGYIIKIIIDSADAALQTGKWLP